MGQKDFTDWNGRKRHDQLFPPKEKLVGVKIYSKKEKRIGLKTKVDRYKAELKNLKTYWGYRRTSQKRRREDEADPHPRGYRRWCPYWKGDIERQIKKLKTMKAQYREEGILDKILAA